jgi:hypothetical protein
MSHCYVTVGIRHRGKRQRHRSTVRQRSAADRLQDCGIAGYVSSL